MKRIKSALSYEQCGAKKIPHKGTLIGHQRQGRYSIATIVRSRTNCIKEEPAPLQDMAPSSFAYASTCQDDFDLINVEFETSIDIKRPLPNFDSNLQLIQFIKNCRNIRGLSRVDTNSLLLTLFHPSFKMEEVTLKNWQDIEKYEAEKYDTEDVSFL